MRIRTIPLLVAWTIVSIAPAIAQFRPDNAMVERISTRFATILQRSGIRGVGQDVLKCYDSNVGDSAATRECAVYDTAAMLLDRQMVQLFIAHGTDAKPSPIFSDKAFDARSYNYGFPAFAKDPADKKLVGPAARKIVDRVFEKTNSR